MKSPTERDAIASRKQKALSVLVRGGTVLTASKAAGVHRSRVYRWLEVDEDFSARLEQAGRQAFRGTVRLLVNERTAVIKRLRLIVDDVHARDVDKIKAGEIILKFSDNAGGNNARAVSAETTELMEQIRHAEKIKANDRAALDDIVRGFGAMPPIRRRRRVRVRNESGGNSPRGDRIHDSGTPARG